MRRRTRRRVIPLLKNSDRETRSWAFFALTFQCGSAKALSPAVHEALTSDYGDMRAGAALFLLRSEPGMASRCIDTLAEQIADPSEGSSSSFRFVSSAREISPISMTTLAARLLERLARATKVSIRANVINALGAIGPDAAAAVPALLEASNSSDLNIATLAALSLVRVDRSAALARLPSLLNWVTPGHDSAIRWRAISSLRALGPAAATAIPALLKLADEDDMAISTGAIEAISSIDPEKGRSLKQAIARGDLGEHEHAARAVQLD